MRPRVYRADLRNLYNLFVSRNYFLQPLNLCNPMHRDFSLHVREKGETSRISILICRPTNRLVLTGCSVAFELKILVFRGYVDRETRRRRKRRRVSWKEGVATLSLLAFQRDSVRWANDARHEAADKGDDYFTAITAP